MAVLDRIYKELLRYGEIKGTTDISSYGNLIRIRYISYEGLGYSCQLCNGEVISIKKYKEEI